LFVGKTNDEMADTVLPADFRETIRQAIAREGLAAFVQRSGASQTAVVRAAGGLPVRAGTAALLQRALPTNERGAGA
jgi:phytoene/squalene synthetase